MFVRVGPEVCQINAVHSFRILHRRFCNAPFCSEYRLSEWFILKIVFDKLLLKIEIYYLISEVRVAAAYKDGGEDEECPWCLLLYSEEQCRSQQAIQKLTQVQYKRMGTPTLC